MQPTVLLPFQPLQPLRLDLRDPKKNDDASSIGTGRTAGVFPTVYGSPTALVSYENDQGPIDQQEHFIKRFPFAPHLRGFESNAASAAFVAVSSVCLDALSSTPPTVVQDVPSTLRCTAFVVLACIGSPVIVPEPNPNMLDIELEQRTLLLVVLALVAMNGEHTAGVYVRVVDAIYCLFSGWVMIGISLYRSKNAVPGSALCGGLFFYSGLRIVRAGMVQASEVVRFSVSGDSFETMGYAVADSTLSTALVFGGSMVACSGLLVLVNDGIIHETGSYSVAPIVCMNAGVAFAAAFVAQLAVYSRLEDLPTLFGPTACNGAHDTCAAAFRARRFHVSNTSPAPLWAAVVALTVYSLPRRRKCPGRADYYVLTKLSSPSGTIAGIVTAASIVSVFVFATDDMIIVQTELILLYIAIPTAWFVSVPAGCVMSIVGNVLYMTEKAEGAFGYDLDFYTHWCLATSAFLTTLLFVSTLISQTLWSLKEEYWLECEHISGGLVISLLSVQTALTLATLALVVGYDGTATTTEETAWRKAGFEFTVQHSLGFFFAAAVYGTRYETGHPHPLAPWAIDAKRRRYVWYATPALLASGWAMRLLIEGYGSPYESFTTGSGLAVGLVAAIVPWMVCGYNA